MPLIFRLHTWVGYDVDGRGDISWSNTFSKRLKVKLEQLLEYEKTIQGILKISKEKELSKDKTCSWMEVECLGACINAPMMQINDDYYEDLNKEKTEKIINQIQNGEKPIPGSYRGRKNSEPENNRKTLLNIKNA